MGIITETDFKIQVKTKKFKQAYFIYGEEKYLVDYYTEMLTKNILSENNNLFNLQNFFSQNLEINDLNSAIESLPLMADLKCVRIFDFNIEKESPATLKKLKEIIVDIPQTTILIISFPNLNVNLKKSVKWNSFIKFFEKYGEVLNLPIMNNLKLKKQLIKWADNLNCKLTEKNAQAIIDKCGDSLLILKNEIEKLCAYASNNNEITSKDISFVVVENFESNVFKLTKSVITKNYDKAFEILNFLFLKKEDPVAILSVIASVYIDIYYVKVARNFGKNIYDLAEIFNYKKKLFKLEYAQGYSKNISMNSLRKTIDLITKTDKKLKSSGLNSKFLLEKLIIKISNC